MKLKPDDRLRRVLEPTGVVDLLLELIDDRVARTVEDRIRAYEAAKGDWITTTAAARISGLTAAAIRERARRGALQTKRAGSRVLVRRIDAEQLRAGRRYNAIDTE